MKRWVEGKEEAGEAVRAGQTYSAAHQFSTSTLINKTRKHISVGRLRLPLYDCHTRSTDTNRINASSSAEYHDDRGLEGGGGIQWRRRSRSSHVTQPGHCAPLRREGPRQPVADAPLASIRDAPGMARSGGGKRKQVKR